MLILLCRRFGSSAPSGVSQRPSWSGFHHFRLISRPEADEPRTKRGGPGLQLSKRLALPIGQDMRLSRRQCLGLAVWSMIAAACGETNDDTKTDWNLAEVFIVLTDIPQGTPAGLAIESNSFGLKTIVGTTRPPTAVANLQCLKGEALRDFAPNTILVEDMFALN